MSSGIFLSFIEISSGFVRYGLKYKLTLHRMTIFSTLAKVIHARLPNKTCHIFTSSFERVTDSERAVTFLSKSWTCVLRPSLLFMEKLKIAFRSSR